jgi:signal peptidase I
MIRRTSIAAVLVLLAIATVGCLKPVRFEGIAMQPTLEDGDRWLVTTNVGDLKRGDIIEFRYPKDETKYYVKRIVGLPNEKIEILEGTVFINGLPITEEYLDQEYNQSGNTIPEIQISSNHYFVMGDNRDNSSDSRYWGTVDRSLIEGKLYVRYISGKENR